MNLALELDAIASAGFVATDIGASVLPVRFRVPPTVTLLTLVPE
jgi:hypothetical protein